HSKLVQLFQQAGIQLLNNNTIQVGRGSARINITGLGDVMALQCKPEEAFRTRDPHIPTIVLSHNPDSYDRLKYFPGELFLFGHTHGGQVNLPYIWKKITPLKNKSLKSGLHIIDNRFLSISRGLGASLPFRWFAPPEITLFTLIRGPYETIKVSQDLFEKAQNPEVVLGSTYSCR
ncbi:MAG TPA: hypothetical protein VN457_02810, partial [Chlamydiales bacterium]|nr:hypothetical protein [Chlamydiales bacterium]